MKSGGRTSLVFTPAPSDVREQRESLAVETKAKDPRESILIYGHMLTDAEIIRAELNGLLFAGSDYVSRLRVIRGAAKRIGDRAAKLLEETE